MTQTIIIGISIFLQLNLSYMLAMTAIFAGCGAVNSYSYTEGQERFLNLSLYLMPLSSLMACALALLFFMMGYGYYCLLFHVIPLIYVIVFFKIINLGVERPPEHYMIEQIE